MIYVIGSGPAGVAAAQALLQANIEVTMLDVGVELEKDKEDILNRLHAKPHEDWEPRLIEQLKGRMRASTGGLPQKRNYGSDYPFRDAGQIGSVEMKGVEVLISGAKGGLSNVWGSNLMPYTGRDIAGWCVTADDLAPHYAAVSSFVPVSARHDDIEEFFPLHVKVPDQLRSSRQAMTLLKNLDQHRQALRGHGFVTGLSRLAVQVNPTDANQRGCVHCGLCLYGCPYRLIYSSALTVRDLQRNPNFHYVPGFVVERLIEHVDHVEICSRSLAAASPQKFKARRVYLACGVIATTRILLESMQAYDSAVSLMDSQYFLFPLLQYESAPSVTTERLHTMAQVYVDIFDEALSARTIQLQLYTYNDLFLAALRDKLKFLFPMLKPLLPAILGRLCIAMGYLHSDDSATPTIRLERSGTGSKLRMEATTPERTRRIIRGVLQKMWRHRGSFQALPIRFMTHICEPGKSYHYGGTFPMRQNPSRFESDRWGRPEGFKRVHAVDATVLPGIAATTIVFTAMANAHRIASACCDME